MLGPEFAEELRPDPRVALAQPLYATVAKIGPLHKVQFVVELVGPRSVPAAVAANLLDPAWFSALGRPETWCMRPADESWAPLTTSTDGSYDSLAVAWDLIAPKAQLGVTSAQALLARCSEFAQHIQRRALPMPVPEDVPKISQAIVGLRDTLDVGFSLAVAPNEGSVAERDLWVACSQLGLSFRDGAFVWLAAANDLPLLEVTPIGQSETFSLAAVNRGDVHEGASIGFRFALCPSPAEALDACFRVGAHLAQAISGSLYDEDGNMANPSARRHLEKELAQAIRIFEQAGIPPGGSEARRIFL